jgi:hypothetical protein
MINDLNPTEKYPSLTDERLSLIADNLREVRNTALGLYDPIGGDDAWSHGCRVYSRSKFRITQLSQRHSWLGIVEEDSKLRFTFAIDGIPIRFYRGSPDDPPSNYLVTTYGELAQRQLFPHRELDKILRIAIETDGEGRVATVKLVELDTAGEATGVYLIPFGVAPSKLTPLQAKPVHVEPVKLEPVVDKERSAQKQNTKNAK